MSEKLFARLYWRPYALIGISMLLIVASSLMPYLLPWVIRNYTGYDVYFFKLIAWLVKFSILLYLYSVYRAFAAGYFPDPAGLCSKEARAVITGYKKTWLRGKQICPVFSYRAGERDFSEALNEAKGIREKTGDRPEKGFTLKLPRKIKYNPKRPAEFYLPGELYYSRKAAIARYVLFSLLYCAQLYLNVFAYMK